MSAATWPEASSDGDLPVDVLGGVRGARTRSCGRRAVGQPGHQRRCPAPGGCGPARRRPRRRAAPWARPGRRRGCRRRPRCPGPRCAASRATTEKVTAHGGQTVAGRLIVGTSRPTCSGAPVAATTSSTVTPGRDLAQHQAVVGDVDDGEVGDDPVDARLAGERQGALLDDLGRPVAGDVLHHDDHPPGAVDEVHRAAHAVDHLAGDQPVGQVAAGVDLHGAEDGDVEVLAADHPEGHRGVEEAGAGQDRDGLLAGVDQVGVLLALERVGADAEDAVLAVQDHVHAVGHVVGHQRRHADAEVDVLAVLELQGDAGGELLAGQCHVRPPRRCRPAGWTVGRGRVVRFSIFLPSVPTTTTRSTKTPGRCTSSGVISPGSTSSSTSAMVIRAGHAGQRVEVARRLVEHQVAVPVADRGADQREVGGQRGLQHVLAGRRRRAPPWARWSPPRCRRRRSGSGCRPRRPACRRRWGCRRRGCRCRRRAAARPACPAGSARPPAAPDRYSRASSLLPPTKELIVFTIRPA